MTVCMRIGDEGIPKASVQRVSLCSVQHDDHPASVLSDPHQQPLGPPSAELRYQSTILGFRQQFTLVHAIMECPDTIDLTPLSAQMVCR